jgi:hypothetical protein
MNALTSDQIQELHERHAKLTAEIRVAVSRVEAINEAMEAGEVPAGTRFEDIGTPLKERPA